MRGSNGRTLYRIPQSGKIAGVCAGIAEYFAIETWLVRVLAVSIFLLVVRVLSLSSMWRSG